MTKEAVLGKERIALLCHSNAHLTFEKVVEDFPLSRIKVGAQYAVFAMAHPGTYALNATGYRGFCSNPRI